MKCLASTLKYAGKREGRLQTLFDAANHGDRVTILGVELSGKCVGID